MDDSDLLSDRVKRGDYYFLNPAPDADGPLAVVCGGRELCDRSYLVDRPGFRFYSLEFVASGRGTVTLGGRASPLGPGSVFSYGPGVSHRIETDGQTPMVKYFVDFAGAEAFRLVERAFPQGTPWSVSSSPWIQRLFEDLKVGADSLHHTRAEVCGLLVRQLLILLSDSALSVPPEEASRSLRFQRLKTQLKELALQGLRLDDATRRCGVSPSYLSRLFRRFETITPHQYVVQCRMAFAASLLLDPQLLVKEVATLSGYDDPYHFSRAFKSVYGQSPESFRHLRT